MISLNAENQKSGRLYCPLEKTCRSHLGNEEFILVTRLLRVAGKPDENKSKEPFVPKSFDERALKFLEKYGMSNEEAMKRFVTFTHMEVPDVLREQIWFL